MGGVVGLIIYGYILCLLIALFIDVSLKQHKTLLFTSSFNERPKFFHINSEAMLLRDHINNCFIILIICIYKKTTQNIIGDKNNKKVLKYFCNIKNSSCISIIAAQYTYWIACLNLVLIIICNPVIVNPGPTQGNRNLSVLYQNIRGFVPPTELPESNPMLNTQKLIDFQSYIFENKPDIVILNESWLSININDSEIFPNQIYKVFRLDRSRKTHPVDPSDPEKFKKNGGGVLIAVKSNLDCESILIKDKCKAEILSVEIRLRGGKSICLSTFYRVGNLEANNHKAVDTYLKGIAKRKKFSKIILIGDLNLDEISWSENSSSNELQRDFIDTFDDLNFDQLIQGPTHIKGKTLDVLLTSCPELISDISIKEENVFCKSDHFAIEFSLNVKINRKKIR